MPNLPVPSQTDVTIQNQTTGQVDFLKYQGNTLVGSALKDYGLGSDFKIVATDNGGNNLPGLVAQSQSTGKVDFLTLDANANLIGTALSSASVPKIFGIAADVGVGVLGSQLANGQLDFLQFNSATGALTQTDLVANSVGLPQAVGIFSWNSTPGPPAWSGLGGGLGGDIVQTKLANGQLDMIGFSGTFAAQTLAVDSTFLTSASVGTMTIGENNPNVGQTFNVQDTTNVVNQALAPQGLQDVAQTTSGQLDIVYFDTGLGDPVASNKGILYASNQLDTFSGWNVVEGGLVAHTDLFPIT